MSPICFTVLGEPCTKGSVVAFVPKLKNGRYAQRPDGSPMVVKHDDTGKRGKSAMATIAQEALIARMEAGYGQVMRDAAMTLTVRFYTARPKGHFGTGRNAGVLKEHAPLRPAKRPDIDKMLRHVLDSMLNVIYVDDSQVVQVLASKDYDEIPRTEIEISPTPQQTVGVTRPTEQLALVA